MKHHRNDDKIRVAITHGDINGIGYEVIIKTLIDNRIIELCTPIVYGSSKVAAYHRKTLNIDNFSLNVINFPDDANPKRANIINCIDEVNTKVELGKSSPMAGVASVRALERAVSDLKAGKVDVLVTAPVNKHNIQSRDFVYPGHTEYLASCFNDPGVLMLMVSEIMKVGIVTGHVPISMVPSLITSQNIIAKLKILNKALIEDFGIRKPVIAVLGLNPHAGDNGLIGTEDEEIVIPAIQKAKEENIMAMGPYPADGFFGSGNFAKFDAVLAMYHDQGLTPFKAVSFDEGVNYTCGLPVIRTSPAHGTAYEITGMNIASDNSFRHAIYLAIDAFNNRHSYAELTANQLQPQEVKRPEDNV
ncbi:MAG: 4-hydroxythreonine-4-phosphate dehydrogenase PdxA [Bacteroidia bacterium]|nr:4-hydroxythreonine-4-phosphate dehydrogenase PdxA [Bacteroidia bacterium]